MIRATTIKLISESPSAHGVFDNAGVTEREVFAEIRSVSRSEYYAASNSGIRPEMVFRLSDEAEYNDEHFCKYNGKKYAIVRTYYDGENGIELTVERSDINA